MWKISSFADDLESNPAWLLMMAFNKSSFFLPPKYFQFNSYQNFTSLFLKLLCLALQVANYVEHSSQEDTS